MFLYSNTYGWSCFSKTPLWFYHCSLRAYNSLVHRRAKSIGWFQMFYDLRPISFFSFIFYNFLQRCLQSYSGHHFRLAPTVFSSQVHTVKFIHLFRHTSSATLSMNLLLSLSPKNHLPLSRAIFLMW